MATSVEMPKMGYDMEEGTILSWAKQEGDTVAKGDVLGEIETGKVNIEIEAFDAGILRKILVAEGQTVDVGVAIAIIGTADEEIEIPPAAAASNGAAAAEGADARKTASPADSTNAVEGRSEGADAGSGTASADSNAMPASSAASSSMASSTGPEGRLRASPLARRIAAEADLPLGLVHGSGPKGRILRDDVRQAIESGLRAPAGAAAGAASGGPASATAAPASAAPLRLAEGDRREDLSGMRRTIARRLSESWTQAPHIFLTMAIEMDAALALRKTVNATLEASDRGKISVNDLVVKAVAVALRQHPRVNVSWDSGARVLRERVNVGVAIALEDGLITLAVADADRRPISQIAAELVDKAGRARAGKLHPDDLSVPSTFTVSNLGGYGIEQFTAIINPPEAAILAVGRAQPEPVVVAGEVAIRSIMRVTLSADHRVIDGASAAEFLVSLKTLLEAPLGMLV
jgi:pyruvate dehydrogenase E2 component (dihydrolipoamide acetyltransferase)